MKAKGVRITDQEIYGSCDIVIEMIDSSYWKIFSKDTAFIEHLIEKFKSTELLEVDLNSTLEPNEK